MKYNLELTKEEYDLIMDLRQKREYHKNEYVIKGETTEIVIRDKFFFEKCRVLIDTNKIIDVKDIRWYLGANGYIMGHITGTNKKNMTLHKIITKTGRFEFVDHVNTDRFDNRMENLRICTQEQNNWNTGTPTTNKSGHRGVRVLKSGKFSAHITYKKKQITLGTFKTFDEAVDARKQAEQKYYGEYAYKGI